MAIWQWLNIQRRWQIICRLFLVNTSLVVFDENVVVSLKGDEDGRELEKEVMKALPKSQKVELDEDGWNGILQEQERQAEAEQIQLVAQYQSQQQSQLAKDLARAF